MSLNWIERAAVRELVTTGADHVHDDAAHVRRRAGAIRLGDLVVVDQPAVPLGVSARQRTVRRLHRGRDTPPPTGATSALETRGFVVRDQPAPALDDPQHDGRTQSPQSDIRDERTCP